MPVKDMLRDIRIAKGMDPKEMQVLISSLIVTPSCSIHLNNDIQLTLAVLFFSLEERKPWIKRSE